MKRTKTVLALIMAFALTISLFTGCGSKAATPAPAKEASATSNQASAAKSEAAPAAATEAPKTSEEKTAETANTEKVSSSVLPTFLGDLTIYSTNDEAKAQKKTPADTIVIGQTINIEQCDPAFSMDTATQWTIFDTLIARDPYTGELKPSLATDWEYLDETHLKLTLRDDVVFHDGSKFTGEDVIFTFQRLMDPTICTKYSAYFHVDVPNCTTEGNEVVIALLEPDGAFINNLAISLTGIVSKSFVEANGEESFFTNPVGTGPYKLVNIISGDRYELERNDDYWGEIPEFKYATIRYYAEKTTMFMDYENGDIDMLTGATEQDAKRALNGDVPNTNIGLFSLARVYGLGITTKTKEELKDVNVRSAIMHAIDFDQLAEACVGILGVKATSLIPTSAGYNRSTTCTYDPELSVQLLEEAGYGPGDLTVELGINSLPMQINGSEAIQYMLGEVGINVEIEQADNGTHITRQFGQQNGGIPEYDIGFSMSSISNFDPTGTMGTYENTSNNAFFRIDDEEFNSWLAIADTSIDPDVRKENYDKAQQYLDDNYLNIAAFEAYDAIVWHDYLDGICCINARAPLYQYVKYIGD